MRASPRWWVLIASACFVLTCSVYTEDLLLDEDDDGGTAELVIGPTSIGLTGRF